MFFRINTIFVSKYFFKYLENSHKTYHQPVLQHTTLKLVTKAERQSY